jgi:hypothetical protein
MEKDHEKELKEIIGDLVCPEGFKCYTRGLKNLSKAEHMGLEPYLECLEEHAYVCPLQMPIVSTHYRRCPVRAHIAKKLKK